MSPFTTVNFRTTMQRLSLDTIRNSPYRLMQPLYQHDVCHKVATTRRSDKPTLGAHRFFRLMNSSGCHTSEHLGQSTAAPKGRPEGVLSNTSLPLGTSCAGDVHYHRVFQQEEYDSKKYYRDIPYDKRWDSIMDNLALLGRVSVGNTVIPYRDSADAFEHMWDAVDHAKQHVRWQTYICKDDDVGRTTVKKLLAAHKRGCQTELLYDCGGNISGRSKLTEELKQNGAAVVAYRPFFRSVFLYVFGGFDWRRSPGLRNHRKILLVDDRVGFCGGLNIGNEYCGKQMGGTGKFRDTHCAVVGPAVAHLAEVYEDTKQPQLWKLGWTRWRQIASASFHRQYRQTRSAMESTVLRPLQNQARTVRRRSGIYFRQQVHKAELGTTRMIDRVRWTKQQEQLRALMKWYNTNLSPAPAPARLQEVDHCNRETSTPKPSNADGALDGLVDSIPGGSDDCATHGGGFRTDAMRRRVSAARARALHIVRDLSHRRSHTRMLLRIPIADDEPVIEAAAYGASRQATTQVLSCNPGYRNYTIQFAFWQVTRKCHRRIWITTPYYLPTRKLLRALIQAAHRGVDVRILAGSRGTTDPWFMWHASNYITERLLRAGVKMYEYRGDQIMHAKTVVADSIWSSIGSYNWDVMSNKNLEVCVCHFGVDVAREMESHFLQDLEVSTQVRLEDHCQRSLRLRCTSWLFYNVVYVLSRVTFGFFVNEDVDD